MKKILLLTTFLFVSFLSFGQCPTTPISLTTQAEVDAFTTTYPACTELQNTLTINGANISNLSALSVITQIGISSAGGLEIFASPILVNLNGLENIQDVIGGPLRIENNASLESISGLSGLNGILGSTSLIVKDNPSLQSLQGLENITQPGDDDLFIDNNDLLTDLTGLDGMLGADDILIWNNDGLTSLNGLGNFELTGTFSLRNNDAMTSISGLNTNLTSAALWIQDHAQLSNLDGLESLTIDGVGEVIIEDNPLLSDCDASSICDRIITSQNNVTIANNAYRCEDVQQVRNICLGCPIEDVVLSSQAEVEAFVTTYPDCDRPGVIVTISGADISDLTPLDGYTLDYVVIKDNPLLDSLEGIRGSSGLTIIIDNNDSLTDFTGLGNSAFNATDFVVINNDGLISFTGLESAPGGVLDKLEVGNNSQLRNIDGLENYRSWEFQGEIEIYDNALLQNIDGLSGLEVILDPGNIVIANNASLINIMGLSNLSGTAIGGITITDNASLSNCSIESFCEFLDANPSTGATISNNEEGCNTRNEVETNCTGCPTNNITLSSQAEVDDFPVNYPGCHILNFDLTISGNDITDLSALSQINTMASRLRVLNNTNLTTLNGLGAINFQSNNGSIELENNMLLATVGDFTPSSLSTIAITLKDNPLLGAIDTFAGITSLGFLEVDNNDALVNLTGLDNVQDCDVLFLYNNELLESVTSLGSIAGSASNIGISNNPALTSLVGLEGYTDLGIDLEIFNNDALESLAGLEGLTNENSQANSVFYVVANNELLTDISALANIEVASLLDIEITNNPNLSMCTNLSICEFLDNGGSGVIENNAPGCNSAIEILDLCNASFNRIDGMVQFDFNMNGCDVNDVPAPNVLIETTNGVDTYATFSNSDGAYQKFLPLEGSVTTAVNTTSLPVFFDAMPASQVTVFTGFGSQEVIDFCITATQTINDLKVVLIPTSEARPGFDTTYQLVYENVGTTQLSGEVTLQFDEVRQTFIEAIPNETSVVGGLVTWSFVDLNPFESRFISVVLNNFPPPTNEIGDILSLLTEITPVTDDANPEDNTHELEQVVIGAFDPNDKQVAQGPVIDEAEVGEYLDYTIRFQNLGTADAIDVVIEDILDANLQWESIRPLSSSHDYRVEIINGNEVSFIFEDINLPPEIVDPEGSNGYIAFQVRTDDTLVLGDEISNTAAIFFDFNPPVITNTVTTIVGDQVAPIAICQPFTVSLDAAGQATIVPSDIDNGSNDPNGIASLVLDITSFDCSDLGENTVTLTVIDTFGNESECTAIVTVLDEMPPQVTCQPLVVSLDANGTATVDPLLLIDFTNSSDNCDIDVVEASVSTVDCNAIDTPVNVTVSVEDASGNMSQCTTTISAVDELPPTFDTSTLPADQTKLTDETGIYLLEDFTAGIIAEDNCSTAVTLSQSPALNEPLTPGLYDISITAADDFSNETEYTFELTVELLLGVDLISIENKISIYPNPVSEILQIEITSGIMLEKTTFYSIQGEKLLVTSEEKVNLNSFAEGVYFALIETNQGVITKKIIKN